MMKDLPSTSLAYRLLLQEERHNSMSKISAQPTDSIVFSAEGPSDHNCHTPKSTTGYKGIRNTHVVTGNKRTNTIYYCEHCHMHGHTIDRCYKIHGYPSETRSNHNKRVAALAIDVPLPESANIYNTGLTKDQFSQLCALLGKRDLPSDTTPIESTDHSYTANVASNLSFFSSFCSPMWIIDSRASDYMCNSLHTFLNLRPIPDHRHNITIL